MDYDSQEYQDYLQRRREERKKKLLEGDAYEKSEAIIEETAGTEPIVAIDVDPPASSMPPIWKSRDPGATGA